MPSKHSASAPDRTRIGPPGLWIVLLNVVLANPAALADDASARHDAQRAIVAHIDNDEFAGLNKRDRWYSSGVRIAAVDGSKPERLGHGWAWRGRSLCPAYTDSSNTGGISHLAIGQNIYTQDQRLRTVPLSNDRPIAAYLYGSAGNRLSSDHADMGVSLEIGVTGPAALGEPIQNGLHDLLGVSRVPAWSYQLRPRLGVNAGFLCLGRWHWPRVSWLGQFDMWAGSTIARAAVSVAVAIGPGRRRATMPARARFRIPGMPSRRGWSLVAGVRGIVTGYDYLLDGKTFRYDNGVRSKTLTGDLFFRAAIPLSRRWLVAYEFSARSMEFDGPGVAQANYRPQRIGSLVIRLALP